ncbi:MAG: nitroreductase [Thermomicrobiales bacterium]|nr:MAG: nitroreductase [Thermomicrobiales bacterium]
MGASTRDLIAFLRGLRQTRTFTERPVPDEALRDILEVARWTGSAVNRQPWELIVVRRRETLRQLAEAHPSAGHLAGAAAAIVVIMAGKWQTEAFDEGRLVERILLAARAHGLGAGIGWLSNDGKAEQAKALLGIPPERFVRTAIALGYPAAPPSGERPRRVGRKPLAEFVYEERYGIPLGGPATLE